jgi:hypothetical protein
MRVAAAVPLLGVVLLLPTGQSFAKTVFCPDISQARQIGVCPAEAEVKRMFEATCGFERDPNAANPEKCDSYAEFKRQKYNVLWESADGEFMSYASCAATPAEIKAAGLQSVAISQQNGLYKVACSYQGGTRFTMRTRAVCRIPGVKSSLVTIRKQCESGRADSCSVECE